MASDERVLAPALPVPRAAAPTDPITAPAISFSQTAPVLIVLGGAVLAILFEAFLPRRVAVPGAGRAGDRRGRRGAGLDAGRRQQRATTA